MDRTLWSSPLRRMAWPSFNSCAARIGPPPFSAVRLSYRKTRGQGQGPGSLDGRETAMPTALLSGPFDPSHDGLHLPAFRRGDAQALQRQVITAVARRLNGGRDCHAVALLNLRVAKHRHAADAQDGDR